MKKTLLILACALVFATATNVQTAYAQNNMSDSEFEGLKGKVKGIVEEDEWTYTPPSGTPETKRQKISEWKYDASGRITEYLN